MGVYILFCRGAPRPVVPSLDCPGPFGHCNLDCQPDSQEFTLWPSLFSLDPSQLVQKLLPSLLQCRGCSSTCAFMAWSLQDPVWSGPLPTSSFHLSFPTNHIDLPPFLRHVQSCRKVSSYLPQGLSTTSPSAFCAPTHGHAYLTIQVSAPSQLLREAFPKCSS